MEVTRKMGDATVAAARQTARVQRLVEERRKAAEAKYEEYKQRRLEQREKQEAPSFGLGATSSGLSNTLGVSETLGVGESASSRDAGFVERLLGDSGLRSESEAQLRARMAQVYQRINDLLVEHSIAIPG